MQLPWEAPLSPQASETPQVDRRAGFLMLFPVALCSPCSLSLSPSLSLSLSLCHTHTLSLLLLCSFTPLDTCACSAARRAVFITYTHSPPLSATSSLHPSLSTHSHTLSHCLSLTRTFTCRICASIRVCLPIFVSLYLPVYSHSFPCLTLDRSIPVHRPVGVKSLKVVRSHSGTPMCQDDAAAAAASSGGGARDSEDWHKISGSQDSGSEGGGPVGVCVCLCVCKCVRRHARVCLVMHARWVRLRDGACAPVHACDGVASACSCAVTHAAGCASAQLCVRRWRGGTIGWRQARGGETWLQNMRHVAENLRPPKAPGSMFERTLSRHAG